jgi:hypothetical protein
MNEIIASTFNVFAVLEHGNRDLFAKLEDINIHDIGLGIATPYRNSWDGLESELTPKDGSLAIGKFDLAAGQTVGLFKGV